MDGDDVIEDKDAGDKDGDGGEKVKDGEADGERRRKEGEWEGEEMFVQSLIYFLSPLFWLEKIIKILGTNFLGYEARKEFGI